MGIADDRAFLWELLGDTTRHCAKSTQPQTGQPCCVEWRRTKFDTQNVVLVEDGDNASLRNICLDGVSPNGIILKPDNFAISFFTKGSWNKACDYIVLTENNGNKFAVFLELKSTLDDQPDQNGHLRLRSKKDIGTAWQLNSASALFDYLCNIEQRMDPSGPHDLNSYTRVFVVLYANYKTGVQSVIRPTVSQQNIGSVSFVHKNIKAFYIRNPNIGRVQITDLL